jgi:1-acyl-sn-glycerol-3-phosphate acyltransferase
MALEHSIRVRPVAYALIEAVFRLVFTYDCLGEEHVPATGPAVVAANHPSYLDPILLSLQVKRPIRFMAYEPLFKVPLLSTILRVFGAFPVDTRPGKGREAYARAKTLVEGGHVVGIFPEGRRSRTGWMESSLREGAARLAWETGAPLVPATITGACRAWPYFRALPTPARVRVKFHEPIDPRPFRAQPEDRALAGLLDELRRRVERSLRPGVKADLRTTVLYHGPAPRPRIHELLAPLAYAAMVWPTAGPAMALLPALGYYAYLAADVTVIRQSRFVKRLRNASALLFSLATGPFVLRVLGLPLAAPAALAAVMAGAWLPYLYERGQVSVGFVRGGVAACLLGVGALALAPLPAGPHVALSAYAAAYAWDRRTIFWRYAWPVLAVYAGAVALTVGGGPGLLLHAAAGLGAWLLTRVFPYHRPAGAPPPGAVVGSAATQPRAEGREPTT